MLHNHYIMTTILYNCHLKQVDETLYSLTQQLHVVWMYIEIVTSEQFEFTSTPGSYYV